MAEELKKGSEEKLTHLKREEVKTMGKDIALIRERESQLQREKITQLDHQKPGFQKETEIKKRAEAKTPAEQFLIPKTRGRTVALKKILIRGLIAVVLIGLIISGAYFLWLKKQSPGLRPEVSPFQEEAEETTKETKPLVPVSLLAVQDTIISEISDNQEIASAIDQAINKEIQQNSLVQIAIQNVSENRFISLEEISFPALLGINLPQEIYQKLDKDYTLALYSQPQGSRVVFITKVKESQGLIELLKDWEENIIQETQPLVSYFKTSFYKNIEFRYLTLSKEDWGICYAHFEDYFVITSSFESFKKAVDNIKPPEADEKLGQLFIVGFEGTVVTPELESFFKKYKPGGILLLSRNIKNESQLKSLIKDLQDISLAETGLPLFVAVDQEGGVISRVSFLKEKTAQFEIETPEQAFIVGQKRGEELKNLGINLNLAPLLDVIESNDFIFNRAFHKSAEEIGDLGKTLIQGQKTTDILTAIKHFPGYGTITTNPEETLAEVESMPEIIQFKKAMEANPELVMIANVVYKEIDSSLPFTFSSTGIELLRNNLGINPLIITDDLDQNSLLKKYSLKEIVTKPIEAGVDLMIFSGWRNPAENSLDAFWSAFENNEISKPIVREAVSKIINFKQNNLQKWTSN